MAVKRLQIFSIALFFSLFWNGNIIALQTANHLIIFVCTITPENNHYELCCSLFQCSTWKKNIIKLATDYIWTWALPSDATQWERNATPARCNTNATKLQCGVQTWGGIRVACGPVLIIPTTECMSKYHAYANKLQQSCIPLIVLANLGRWHSHGFYSYHLS